MGMRGLTVDGRAEDVITEHEAVLVAVKERNVINARNAMAKHLETSKRAVLKGLTLEVSGRKRVDGDGKEREIHAAGNIRGKENENAQA
jgi:uncharacterized protein YabE (DUF348 family)